MRVRVFRPTCLSLLLVLTGCPVSRHHGSDLSKLEHFKIEKGQTTEKDLVDHLGPPENTTARSDGSKILTWTDVRTNGTVNAATAMPLIGGAFGNQYDATTTRKILTATVRAGVVVDYVLNEGSNRTAY